MLRRSLLKPDVRILYADEQTAYHYATVYRQLRKQGTPIPTNDMWIAALVLPFDFAQGSASAIGRPAGLCAREVLVASNQPQEGSYQGTASSRAECVSHKLGFSPCGRRG